MTGIFINYRTGDVDYAAAAVDERLAAVFGRENVFRDSRSLPLGLDFRPELWDRLLASTIMLVLIGSRWMSLTDRDGHPRIDNPDDFVRREIKTALEHGLRVIPILLAGVALPTTDDLPDDIAGLANRQYLRLRQRESTIDLDHLVTELRLIVPPSDLPCSQPPNESSVVIQRGSYFADRVTFAGDNVLGDKHVHGNDR